MSTAIVCPVPDMQLCRGTRVKNFGKDCTGSVSYDFNHQGFRGNRDFDFVPDYAFFGCSLVFGIGVDQSQLFCSQFNNFHNYGLAGAYDNHDINQVLTDFLRSELYDSSTHMAVVWHSRDSECLPEFHAQLEPYPIQHFFCGDPLQAPGCYRFIGQRDLDVSGTHPGPRTHFVFGRILCALFDQS